MIPRPYAPYGLPDPALREALLRVCLSTPDGLSATDITRALDLAEGADLGPLRGMTTLFCTLVEGSGHRVRHPVLRRWQALALREDRRHEMLRDQLAEVDALARDQGVDMVAFRGLRLARDVYPTPSARHCHALHFAVPPYSNLPLILRGLHKLGWDTEVPRSPLLRHRVMLRGKGRVEVALHLKSPQLARLDAQLSPNQRAALDVIDALSAAAREPTSHADRWVTDLVFLLRAHAPDPKEIARGLIADGTTGTARPCLERVLHLTPTDCAARPQLETLIQQLGGRGDGWAFWLTKQDMRVRRRLAR